MTQVSATWSQCAKPEVSAPGPGLQPETKRQWKEGGHTLASSRSSLADALLWMTTVQLVAKSAVLLGWPGL